MKKFYQNQFLEQFTDLKALCKDYDDNKKYFKQICTCIRVLVHDTRKSVSLLSNLGLKHSIKYQKTAKDEDQGKCLITGSALVMCRIRGVESTILPVLRDGPFPFVNSNFKDWWECIVFKGSTGSLTRKEIVLTTANKIGGAHVDENGISSTFEESKLGFNSIINIMDKDLNKHKIDTSEQLQAMIRQIAEELIISLENTKEIKKIINTNTK